MEKQIEPEEVYRRNAEKYSAKVIDLKKIRNNVGWLRLLAVIVMAIAAYYGFSYSWLNGWVIIIIGIAVFLALISLDVKNNERIRHLERLLFLNEEEVKILSWQYAHRESGSEFLPHDHPYAADLDLFGGFSIYQYVNRCSSEQGKTLLAAGLLAPLSAEAILQRQDASNELKEQPDWRQEFQCAGLANPVSLSTQIKINGWLTSVVPYTQNYWQVVVIIFSTISLFCLAAYIADLLPSAIFSLLVLIFFIVSLLISRKVNETYSKLSKIVNEVQTLQQQLQLFEKLNCVSSLLTSLQQQLKINDNASSNILALRRILDRFDFRLNVFVFLALNTFLLWDLRQMISLNKWKKKNAGEVDKWFAAIAEIELLTSLSTLSYNHPHWASPSVSHNHFTLEATNVGHPLIEENKRIDNSFSTIGTGKVSIITGSNMAGKSTFLRSIGVNLVLAQLGAVVCSEKFVFSPVRLYSSMRVADNLAENASTFYAELKTLKTIIEKVNNDEKVFILLDEILRGTNSLDKHTGSEALIRQLIRQHAVAIIATHDVELGNLKDHYQDQIENYYFDVQIEGEELYFDYKVKRGICKSMNASLLMKKIGIELMVT